MRIFRVTCFLPFFFLTLAVYTDLFVLNIFEHPGLRPHLSAT